MHFGRLRDVTIGRSTSRQKRPPSRRARFLPRISRRTTSPPKATKRFDLRLPSLPSPRHERFPATPKAWHENEAIGSLDDPKPILQPFPSKNKNDFVSKTSIETDPLTRFRSPFRKEGWNPIVFRVKGGRDPFETDGWSSFACRAEDDRWIPSTRRCEAHDAEGKAVEATDVEGRIFGTLLLDAQDGRASNSSLR